MLAWGEPGTDAPEEAVVVISDPTATEDGLRAFRASVCGICAGRTLSTARQPTFNPLVQGSSPWRPTSTAPPSHVWLRLICAVLAHRSATRFRLIRDAGFGGCATPCSLAHADPMGRGDDGDQEGMRSAVLVKSSSAG